MPLRVAIVGCGKVADAHAAQIRRIRGCELVGVCDREELMARQLAERFGAERYFTELEEMLTGSRPDVVHITTPPQSHFDLARQCLEHGCHVYVEKPFTVNAKEAEALISLAGETGRRLTVGHDGQFSPAAQKMRELVRAGYLGNSVLHMDSYYGYDLGDAAYAGAFLADTAHWVRRLPGGLLQNIISHGLARVAEFLQGDRPHVKAHAFTSRALAQRGARDVFDELRVMIVDERSTTAYFTFSSGMRPVLNQFHVFGSRNGLVLDETQQTVVKLRGAAFKSYVERFVPPLIFARQHMANSAHNIRLFLNNTFHMDEAKKNLFSAFYRSITEGEAVPISYREILLTATLMDSIFEQIAEVIPC